MISTVTLLLCISARGVVSQMPAVATIPCAQEASGQALGQCVLDSFNGYLAQLGPSLPLPDYHFDNGYYRISVDQTSLTGADLSVTSHQMEVNVLDESSVHVMIYFNLTELRATMHARLSYDLYSTRVHVEGWPEVRVSPEGQSMLDVQLRVQGAGRGGAAATPGDLQVEFGSVMVMLPMEAEVTANLMDTPWYVPYAVTGNLEQEFRSAIINDWWMGFNPSVSDWLSRYLQNVMFPMDMP